MFFFSSRPFNEMESAFFKSKNLTEMPPTRKNTVLKQKYKQMSLAAKRRTLKDILTNLVRKIKLYMQ